MFANMIGFLSKRSKFCELCVIFSTLFCTIFLVVTLIQSNHGDYDINALIDRMKHEFGNVEKVEEREELFESQFASVEDLIAGVFFDKNDAEELKNLIIHEKSKGLRDDYFLPNSYKSRLSNLHFNDVKNQEQWQKVQRNVWKLIYFMTFILGSISVGSKHYAKKWRKNPRKSC